jgi:hypothetical protein
MWRIAAFYLITASLLGDFTGIILGKFLWKCDIDFTTKLAAAVPFGPIEPRSG